MIPRLIDERIVRALEGIYTACTGITTEVKTYTCNVKLEDGENTELFDIPFIESLKHVHHHSPETVTINGTDAAGPVVNYDLQEGDRVFVVFSKYPLAGVSARRFDLNDGVIIAKL